VQDHEQAFSWWLKAAQKGNADAQNNVGACYFSGAGAERDYQKAAEWYRKAADQGCTAAQAELGWMYFTGHGVTRDKEMARQWWAKSADDSAKSKLGLHVLADTKRLTPEGDNAVYGCIMGISPDGTFPDQILYIGDDGIICSKLKLADASKSLQEEYGYSPERAAAYRAERSAKQRADAETRLNEMEGELRRLTALRRQRQIDDLNDNLRDLTATLEAGPNARNVAHTARDLHSVQDLDEAIYNLQESIDRMTEEPLKK
jgi:TPR repeat protein